MLAQGWGYRRWQWKIKADIHQAALKGENFPWMGRVRRRFVKANTRAISSGVLEAWLEDMGMRARRIVLVELEWSGTPSGSFVFGSGMGKASRSDAFKCLRRRLAAVPTFISRQWRIKVREFLP